MRKRDPILSRKDVFNPLPLRSETGGGSLIEMLAVMALIGSLLATVTPVAEGMMRGFTRSASLDLAFAMLEQTRGNAIAEGRSAYLAFADEEFPAEQQHRMVAIFLDDHDPANPPVQVTPWKELPKGAIYQNLPRQVATLTASEEILFPVKGTAGLGLPFIKFEPTGEVSHPVGPQNERLYVQFSVKDTGLPKEGIQIARFSGKSVYFKEE